MPSGGQLSAGSGLRLQATTPGVTDNGNFNINGVGRAGRFTTAQSDVSQETEMFGHKNTCLGNNGNNVIVGTLNTAGSGATGTYVMFGYNNQATGQGNIAIGIGNLCGPIVATGFANNLAFGKDCQCGNGPTEGANRIAYGYQCISFGNANMAYGRQVTMSNATDNAGGEVMGVGMDVACGAFATANVLIGVGVRPSSVANCLVVGYFAHGSGTVFPAVGEAGNIDNSIKIGNDSQTIVKVGAYQLGPGSSGTTLAVLDADCAPDADVNVVLMELVSVTRTVSLPPRTVFDKGKRITIGDSSGTLTGLINISIVPNGGELINGVFGPLNLTTAYACITLLCIGNVGYIIESQV